MAYIGSSPTKVVSRQSANIFTYTATANQTAFTGSDANGNTLACTPSDIMVHMNGLRLEKSDYVATTTTVTLGSGAAAGDEVTITAFVTFETADAYTKSASDARYVNVTGDNMSGNLTTTGSIGVGTTSPSSLIDIHVNSSTAYSATAEPREDAIIHNINGSDGSGANNHATLGFHVANGATSQGFLNYVRTADNTGAFTVSQRTGSSSYAEHLKIDSAGRVTIPNQPSFHAGISANDNRASGYYNHSTGSSWYVISNIGSHFSSGTFTAPVTGVYQFNATLVAAYVDQYLQYWNVVFEKNGSGAIGQNWNGYRSGQATYKSINNQCAIYLQANDYIRVKSECSTTLNTLGHTLGLNSMFSGFLVG